METMSRVPLNFALIRRLAFQRFCEAERMQWDMMGQGGGREFETDRIGAGVSIIGQGGGRHFGVVPDRECVP
jgi:hypothetical protein